MGIFSFFQGHQTEHDSSPDHRPGSRAQAAQQQVDTLLGGRLASTGLQLALLLKLATQFPVRFKEGAVISKRDLTREIAAIFQMGSD